MIKHQKLSEQVATLTEDLEELKSEKSMLLNSMECADDAAFSKFKRKSRILIHRWTHWNRQKINSLPNWTEHCGEIQGFGKKRCRCGCRRIDRHQNGASHWQRAIRSQSAKIYGVKYDYDMMRQSKLEVKKMLGEVTRKPSITQMLQRKEPESQMQKPPKRKQKDYER